MSIFVVLKFLNKMFPLFTIFLELCSDFNIPVASASCIIIWFVSTYIISKFFKTGDPSAEHRLETNRNLSLQECTVMTNFKKHSFLLKRISCQIAEDRKHLMQTIPLDYPALEYHLLEVLESKHLSVFEIVSKTVELKNTAQNRRIGEVVRSLDELQDNFLAVKNLLQQSPYCLAMAKKSFGNNREQYEEVIYSELLNEIEAATKECFSKLESETKMKGKEVINSISRYIDKSRKDIRQELTLFSSAVEKTEKDRKEASNISLISKVEKIEKNLLDTVVFLNRQRFDMENLQKILKHFDEKFTYVATKFDAYWNQSKTAYSNAAQRLEMTVNLWTEVSEKVDNSSGKLIKMLESVTAMISDTQNTLKLRQCDDISESGFKVLAKNSEDNFNFSELSFFENFETFNRKFEDLLFIAENTKDKLLSLTQASKSLQNSHDLIRSITEGYNSLLSFFWPSLEKSTTLEAKLARENQYKNGESCIDPWKAMDILIREGDASEELQWDDVLHGLNKEFPDLDIDKIVSLLKDIVKTSCDLIYYGRMRSEKESMKEHIKEGNFEESDQWEDKSSESLLSDVSSICLVQNSDDSESEAMESCLEIDYL